MTDEAPTPIKIPLTIEQMATWMLRDIPAWWKADLILANRYHLEARQSALMGCQAEADQYRHRADLIYGRVTRAYLQYMVDLAEEEKQKHTTEIQKV